MAKDLPAGFDASKIITGLHKAMDFGAATRAADKAAFYTVTRTVPEDTVVDEDGIPYDPSVTVTVTRTSKVVACAIEYTDRTDKFENFGVVNPSRIKITLLDPDYQQVKGFEYVVVGADKYIYRLTEPPVALGSIDVWTVHAVSEDEV